MRLVLAALLIATLGASSLVISYRQKNSTLEQQVSDLSTQAERLLGELGQQTRQRLADENRVTELTEQIAGSQAQIRVLSQQLAEVRERIDPAVEQMEVRLRERLDVEYQQRLADATAELMDHPPNIASIVFQLGNLSTEERVALMSVQSQYGSFLDSLDVNAERKERITQALLELNLSQTQVRRDLTTQGLEPRELARQMMALVSQEAIRDTLAYDLTDEELAAFDTFQEQRQATLVTGAVGSGGVYMIRGEGTSAANIIQQNGDIIINPTAESGQLQRLIIQGATSAQPDQ